MRVTPHLALDARAVRAHDAFMKKALLSVGVVIGLVVMAKRFAPKMQHIDWEKRFDTMPDNAPPKWMFNNLRAIRDNTDRILELLTSDRQDATAVAGRGG